MEVLLKLQTVFPIITKLVKRVGVLVELGFHLLQVKYTQKDIPMEMEHGINHITAIDVMLMSPKKVLRVDGVTPREATLMYVEQDIILLL
jgi:hypothetical protein